MNDEFQFPETPMEVIKYFADPEVCHKFATDMRWPDGVSCPWCAQETGTVHTLVSFIASRKIWRCGVCKKQFSVKVGPIFEDSPLPMDKWIVSMWLILNAKNGISSCALARAIGITQKSAWFVLHRIRLALRTGTIEKMFGTVEVDETLIGGLEKNKHANKKQKAGRGAVGKAIVLGALERAESCRKVSQVRCTVIPDTTQDYIARAGKGHRRSRFQPYDRRRQRLPRT